MNAVRRVEKMYPAWMRRGISGAVDFGPDTLDSTVKKQYTSFISHISDSSIDMSLLQAILD